MMQNLTKSKLFDYYPLGIVNKKDIFQQMEKIMKLIAFRGKFLKNNSKFSVFENTSFYEQNSNKFCQKNINIIYIFFFTYNINFNFIIKYIFYFLLKKIFSKSKLKIFT